MNKRFLLIAIIAVAITAARAAAQSHGPSAGANPDPLAEITDVTGKSSDGMSLLSGLSKNIKATGAKIPDTGVIGAIGTANKIVSVGGKIASSYKKDGVAAATGTLVKEAAGKVAGDYVGNAVGATVTVWTAPVLGPLAPVLGTAIGFGAKKVTQTVVKTGLDMTAAAAKNTVDSIATGLKNGKWPDSGKPLSDAQYESTGGDRGWQKGDVYVDSKGKKHVVGGERIKEGPDGEGATSEIPFIGYVDEKGFIQRPPEKTPQNSLVPALPGEGPSVFGADGKRHPETSKTKGGTPLPPGSYVDEKTGNIMTKNVDGEWVSHTEAGYRENINLLPLPKNDWASTLGALTSSTPGGCSSSPGGCSDTPATTSSDSHKDKKDSSATAGASESHGLERQQAVPNKNITIPPATPVADGTTMLALDPPSLPIGNAHESESSMTGGGTAPSSTSAHEKSPTASMAAKTVKTTEPKAPSKTATDAKGGEVHFSMDEEPPSSEKSPGKTEAKVAAKSAAQDSAKSAAQDAAKSAAQDVVKSASRPPVGGGGPSPGAGGGCGGPCGR